MSTPIDVNALIQQFIPLLMLVLVFSLFTGLFKAFGE
jgi:hypothetical protein